METMLSSTPPLVNPAHKNRHFFLIFLISLTIASLAITTYLLFSNKNVTPSSVSQTTQQKALISGTFKINGAVPPDATILVTRTNLAARNDTASAEQNFPAVDQGTWSFTNAISGKTYEVTAHVIAQGKTIATSDPIVVTAPGDETITFNIPTQHPAGSAVISGTIHVNGYIPSGATIRVQGRKLGTPRFATIAENLPGASRQFISYTTAVAGQTYEVIGSLIDNTGNQIGTSSVLVVTAPALNETLMINSQAVPLITLTPTIAPTVTPVAVTTTQAPSFTPTPVPTPTMLSGSIEFNGVAPANSRIVILQKVYNSQEYQVAVDNVTPTDDTTWQWQGAKLAKWYDLIAVLKQKQSNGTDVDIARSQMQSVAAPGTGVTLIINSGIVLSAPNGTITASCGNLSGGIWNGQVAYTSVPSAQSYWLQIGTSNGANDTFNAMQNTNNQATQTINMSLNNGTTYYARYAYATNQNAGQPQFSPFSATTQFRCSQ